MNAKSVNDKRLADSEIEEGEITEAIEKIVKKRIVNKKTEDEDEKGIHQISASKNQSKKKKMKKSLIAEDSMKIDPKKEEPKHDESNDEEKLIINNSEEDNDDETSSKKKRKKKEPQTFAKMDIENYPEQQILLCSYNDCPMLVHISNVDIKLPNQFYITQRKVRTTGEKNTFREDPNVIEYSLDKGIKKYWEQRYFLFNKYDEGIKLDRESWYSATPESVAYYTANRLRGAKVILDAFCGAGGNTIQFAAFADKVISNDLDPVKVDCLKNNAQIYGVQDKIEIKNSDYLKLDLGERKAVDLVFLAPPWGGTDYTREDYSIFDRVTPDIREILDKSFKYSQNIVLNLGRNTLLQEIVQLFAEYFEKYNINPTSVGLEIEKIYVSGKLKMIAVYYGQIATLHRSKEYEYCYSLFKPDPTVKKSIKALFKTYGIRKFLQWLQKYEKKYNLTAEDALAYKTHIEGTAEPLPES